MTAEELAKLYELLAALPDQIFAVLLAIVILLIFRDCIK